MNENLGEEGNVKGKCIAVVGGACASGKLTRAPIAVPLCARLRVKSWDSHF